MTSELNPVSRLGEGPRRPGEGRVRSIGSTTQDLYSVAISPATWDTMDAGNTVPRVATRFMM
jgi:hypothetical protein